jgi:hypothetical protein
MDRADVDLAIEWAAREGWNPGLEDAAGFHAADPEGFLISEDADGTPVATMSAVRHGDGLGFVGFYIVAPERRGEGHAIAIWRAGLEPVFETARMYAGAPPAIPVDRVYGVTSFELG